jgi:hypothetical protein
MKVGNRVIRYSEFGKRKEELIVEDNVPAGLELCFKTSDGALFYMKQEPKTGRHYNVGNKAFWL